MLAVFSVSHICRNLPPFSAFDSVRRRTTIRSLLNPYSNFALTAAQKTDARAALSLLDGTEISLEEAARRAIVGRRPGKRATVAEAVDLFIRSRLTANCRDATVAWYQDKLSRFVTMWEHRLLDSITRAEIRDAVEEQGVSAGTQAGLARAVRALWRYCAALEPPLTGMDVTHGLRTVPPRKAALKSGKTSGRKAFLPVPAVEKLLRELPQYRDALAMMLFAGVRPCELGGKHKPRLLWENINQAEQHVRVPDEVAKTGKARIIQRLPPTLWAWLSGRREYYNEDPVSDVLSTQIRRAATKVLGRELPFDCFRHTFATYAVALLGEGNTVSLWLGHEGSPTLLYTTYAGTATHGEAEKFWALRPAK